MIFYSSSSQNFNVITHIMSDSYLHTHTNLLNVARHQHKIGPQENDVFIKQRFLGIHHNLFSTVILNKKKSNRFSAFWLRSSVEVYSDTWLNYIS